MQITTFAGVDIGSYEVGMKIFELSSKYGMREITYVRHRIDLGRDAYTTGRISTEVMDELCVILTDFMHIMKEYQVQAYRACVTSAIRESDNALIVLDHIKVRSGMTVEALSNSEQRFLGYKSIAYQGKSFEKMIQKGTAIFDVGGGSIQLSLFDKDRLVTTENIRMGIIRIRERLQRLEDRPSYMVPLIEELVNSEIGAFQRMYVKDREIRSVILIGDYINYVVRRYRKKPEGDTPFVTKEELMADMEQLIALSPAQIAKRLEIPAENESMILPALVVYRKLLKDTPAELIWAPGLNLSDGLAYDYAEQHKIIRGSHNFENDILAAAKNIAKRYQADRPHVAHVADLALTIFDAMRKPAGLKDRDRLLLNISGLFFSIKNPTFLSQSSFLLSVNVGFLFIGSPLKQSGSPGQPGAKTGQNDGLSPFQQSFAVRLIQQDRNAGCGCIAAGLHIHGKLADRRPDPSGRRLQNALVGLVQQEKIHVFCRQTGLL